MERPILRKVVLPLAALGILGTVAFGAIGTAEAAVAGGRAVLDSGVNFTEPHGSQGIGGAAGTCQRVNLIATGSIRFVAGTLTLWTGPNCTGKSFVVKKDIANLKTRGFGHTRSVRIGAA